MKITREQRNALVTIFGAYKRKFQDLTLLYNIQNAISRAETNVDKWHKNNHDPEPEELKECYDAINEAVLEWQKYYGSIDIPPYELIEKIISPYDFTPKQQHIEPEIR